LGLKSKGPAASHAFFIRERAAPSNRRPGLGPIPVTLNLLIPRCFDTRPHEYVNSFALQHKTLGLIEKRFHWRTFGSALLYLEGRSSSCSDKESQNGLENT